LVDVEVEVSRCVPGDADLQGPAAGARRSRTAAAGKERPADARGNDACRAMPTVGACESQRQRRTPPGRIRSVPLRPAAGLATFKPECITLQLSGTLATSLQYT